MRNMQPLSVFNKDSKQFIEKECIGEREVCYLADYFSGKTSIESVEERMKSSIACYEARVAEANKKFISDIGADVNSFYKL